MKLNSFSLAAIIFVMLFGGIGVTTAMNWWQTENIRVPVTYTEGEAAGQYNPADIRGSYAFGEISELFDVPLEDLQAAFRLPEDVAPADYQVKSLEAQFADLPVEMGTASVRMFVAFYKGLPYDISADEDTFLFPEAAAVLNAQGKMTSEQAGYLENHILQEAPAASAPEDTTVIEPTADAEPTPALAGETEAAPAPTEHEAPEKTVTGKTTFQDLLNWGVSQESIEAILGEPMPEAKTLIKDYVTQKGLTFSSLKAQLQAEVDSQ